MQLHSHKPPVKIARLPRFAPAAFVLWILTTQAYSQSPAFTDYFTHGIDSARWRTPTQAWGGDNGGVNSQNVHWQTNPIPQVLLQAQGDLYKGNALPNATRSTRVGAVLVTQQTLGPGTVTICAKLPQTLGVVSAFWLYNYHTTGTQPLKEWINEIDWETPTDNDAGSPISYDFARANSWGGQVPGDEALYSGRINLKTANGGTNPSADGGFHLYSITWRERMTDKQGQVMPGYISWGYAKNCADAPQEVRRYIGKTSGVDNIPVRPMALWLGLWFPASGYQGKTGWAGNPDFAETTLAIRSVSYQPG